MIETIPPTALLVVEAAYGLLGGELPAHPDVTGDEYTRAILELLGDTLRVLGVRNVGEDPRALALSALQAYGGEDDIL